MTKILGLDLGTNSIGWAYKQRTPSKLRALFRYLSDNSYGYLVNKCLIVI